MSFARVYYYNNNNTKNKNKNDNDCDNDNDNSKSNNFFFFDKEVLINFTIFDSTIQDITYNKAIPITIINFDYRVFF